MHPTVPRAVGIASIVAGVILIIAGAATWITVRNELADEKISVSEDAERFQGDQVDGPLTAYYEADAIEQHALEEGGGLTYAQLDRQDPRRQTVQGAAFLRASLFTSVVSFGVAALAAGLGLLFILLGVGMIALAGSVARLDRRTRQEAEAAREELGKVVVGV